MTKRQSRLGVAKPRSFHEFRALLASWPCSLLRIWEQFGGNLEPLFVAADSCMGARIVPRCGVAAYAWPLGPQIKRRSDRSNSARGGWIVRLKRELVQQAPLLALDRLGRDLFSVARYHSSIGALCATPNVK